MKTITRLQALLPMMLLPGILLSAEPPPKKPASTTPPDMTNVVYGSDKKFNVIDLWKAKSDKPTPLVIFIHGGGFGGGNKEQILTQFPLDEILKAGVSCAS